MSYKELKQKTEGFTIIEVLIVLAIAALIMLIVFLAIPQLRRNQQNNQLRSEAARVLTAATEYESNANGTQVDGTSVASVYNSAVPTPAKAQLKSTTTYGTPLTATSVAGDNNLVVGTCGNTTPPVAATVAYPVAGRTYALEFVLNGGQHACIQS